MKQRLFVLLVALFTVTGCGSTAFHQRTVRNGSEVISSYTKHRDRNGDVDVKEDVDVSGGGYGYGSVMGGDSLIDPPGQLIYQPVPKVTYGERLEETFPGSAMVPAPSSVDTTDESDVNARLAEQLRALYKKVKEHDALFDSPKSEEGDK